MTLGRADDDMIARRWSASSIRPAPRPAGTPLMIGPSRAGRTAGRRRFEVQDGEYGDEPGWSRGVDPWRGNPPVPRTTPKEFGELPGSGEKRTVRRQHWTELPAARRLTDDSTPLPQALRQPPVAPCSAPHGLPVSTDWEFATSPVSER